MKPPNKRIKLSRCGAGDLTGGTARSQLIVVRTLDTRSHPPS